MLTFPIANNPLSKSKMTPRKRNETPNPARPTPISEKELDKINTVINKNHLTFQNFIFIVTSVFEM